MQEGIAACTRTGPQNGGSTDSRVGAMNETSPAGFRASTTHRWRLDEALPRVQAHAQGLDRTPR